MVHWDFLCGFPCKKLWKRTHLFNFSLRYFRKIKKKSYKTAITVTPQWNTSLEFLFDFLSRCCRYLLFFTLLNNFTACCLFTFTYTTEFGPVVCWVLYCIYMYFQAHYVQWGKQAWNSGRSPILDITRVFKDIRYGRVYSYKNLVDTGALTLLYSGERNNRGHPAPKNLSTV